MAWMQILGVLVSFLMGASCMEKEPAMTVSPAPSIPYLALGDSYTRGEQVDILESFPWQTSRKLKGLGFDCGDPRIIARTGWTTAELQAGIDREMPLGTFDLVSLLIGVNNQFRGYPLDQYRDECLALMKRAIGFAGDRPSRVFILSIPDWGASPYGAFHDREKISREIDAFNSVNRTLADSLKLHYLDITPLTRNALTDLGLITGDGLHPSAKAYSEWAALLADQMKAELK